MAQFRRAVDVMGQKYKLASIQYFQMHDKHALSVGVKSFTTSANTSMLRSFVASFKDGTEASYHWAEKEKLAIFDENGSSSALT